MSNNLKIAIIGGGASGTAAAHKLQGLGYQVTIIEKGHELGGRIQSKQINGVNVEMGASFITSGLYTNTFKVIEKASLTGDLQIRKSRAAIIRNGVEKLPKSLMGNSWLSFGTKLTLVKKVLATLPKSSKLDINKMWRATELDSLSVKDAYKSRQEKELLNYLLQPMLQGYFYWKPERVSNAMLMILMKSMLRNGKTYILRHGLQQIPKWLSGQCKALLDSEVKGVTKQPNGKYIVEYLQNGTPKHIADIDGIVCTTTATVVSKIFPDLNKVQRSFFSSIKYSSTTVVARSYSASTKQPAYAVAYPSVENNQIAAFTSVTNINEKGQAVEVIKTYASSHSGDRLSRASEEQIISELYPPESLGNRIVEKSAMLDVYVQKWAEALPEYNVGHMKLLKSFNDGNIESSDSKLVFAGDYLGGPFIEGAITSGFQAADRLCAQLLNK